MKSSGQKQVPCIFGGSEWHIEYFPLVMEEITTGAIKEVLADQWEAFFNRPDLVDRDSPLAFEEILKIPHAVMISGVRRCGKSSLMSLWAHRETQRTESLSNRWA